MDVVAGLIELKPGTEALVQEWAQTINSRMEEAVATLKDEGVSLESWFHLSLDGKEYLLSYMRCESHDDAAEAGENSEHAIDAFHSYFKEKAWGKGVKATLLVDLVGNI